MDRLINGKLIAVFHHNNLPQVVIVDLTGDKTVHLYGPEEVQALVDTLRVEGMTTMVTSNSDCVLMRDSHAICRKCEHRFKGFDDEPCARCCAPLPTGFKRKE
jgi:hypothetical protein